MPTKTPRERFEEEWNKRTFHDIVGMYTDDTHYEVSSFAIWSFFETLLEEARQEGFNEGHDRMKLDTYDWLEQDIETARQEGREEMRKKCIEMVWKYNCSEDRIATLIEENILSL